MTDEYPDIDWKFGVGDFVNYGGDEVEITGRIYNVDKEEYAYLIVHHGVRPAGGDVMEYAPKDVLEEYSY